MKKIIHIIILSFFPIILLFIGCPIINDENSRTPPPIEESSPAPTVTQSYMPTDVPADTPAATEEPVQTPPPNPIREELEPVLKDAATDIDINECFNLQDPVMEDPNSGYDVYISDIQWTSTDVICQGDDTDIQFSLYFNNVTGDVYFDCTCSGLACLCSWIGGDASGDFTADVFIVSGNINCIVNAQGKLESYTINEIIMSIENLEITTNNAVINDELSGMLEFLDDILMPCIEDLVYQAFCDALDNYINN